MLHTWFYSEILNNHLEKWGYNRFPNDARSPNSQVLTIYAYPEELNYNEIRTKTNWFNLEVFNKIPPRKLNSLADIVPAEFVATDLGGRWSGKWIYLSMGSMGQVDIPHIAYKLAQFL